MSEGLNNFKYYVMRTNDVGQKMAKRARAEESWGSKLNNGGDWT